MSLFSYACALIVCLSSIENIYSFIIINRPCIFQLNSLVFVILILILQKPLIIVIIIIFQAESKRGKSIVDKVLQLDKVLKNSNIIKNNEEKFQFEEDTDEFIVNGLSEDPDSNPFLEWLKKLYNSIFFFGLDEPNRWTKDMTKIKSKKKIRGKKSPFFTAPEQFSQQLIKETSVNNDATTDIIDDEGDDDDDGYKSDLKTRASLLESLEEELNIIEASKLVGNSDYLNSKEYYDKSRLRAEIIKQIKNH